MQILTPHNHRKQFHLKTWREKGMELSGNSGTAIVEWPNKNCGLKYRWMISATSAHLAGVVRHKKGNGWLEIYLYLPPLSCPLILYLPLAEAT